MALDPNVWTAAVGEALRKYSPDTMPLTRSEQCDTEGAESWQTTGASQLFPQARAPEAALSGLLLLAGWWAQSHELSQDIETREGSYWHAIAHRIESDSANAAYWFRRVGEHAIFPDLRTRAAEVLEQHAVGEWRLGARWDPYLFLEWCEQARQKPGTKEEQAACAIQGAEWKLLFHWCAGQAVRA